MAVDATDAAPTEAGVPARPDARHGPKGERTRQRILAAARRCFGRTGYDRATIRGIAAEARVDKSSVLQYFGTKQALFREAVHWDIPISELTTADASHTVQNYLSSMLGSWAADVDSPMSVLLRTSMTSEEAADLLRRHVTAQSVDPIAAQIDSDDARLRAGLFSAIMMGIASGRYLLRLPDLVDADLDELLRVAGPLVQGLIRPDETAGDA